MRSTREPVHLTPAAVYVLMTGQTAEARLPGWVAVAQAGQVGEPTLDQVWAQHQVTILAAADANGFAPYWLTHRTPTEPGFCRWRDAFVAEHAY